jgi:sulfur carrier protein ThiS
VRRSNQACPKPLPANVETMKIQLKLYASLGQYLPAEAKKNQIEVEVQSHTTVGDLLRKYTVPDEMCHLVLVNGKFVSPGERGALSLNDGDALAVWPPVAGG